MGDETHTCPRCGSGNTERDARTDIPGDRVHGAGCKDCLFVWDP